MADPFGDSPPFPQRTPSPPPSAPIDRPASDLDIECLRLLIKNNAAGSATCSAPRPWLSADDNAQIARSCASIWNDLDAKLEGIANLPLQDRPPQNGLNSVVIESIRASGAKHGIKEVIGDRLVDAGMGKGDAAFCLARDLERAWGDLEVSMIALSLKSLDTKATVVESLTQKFGNVSDSPFSFGADESAPGISQRGESGQVPESRLGGWLKSARGFIGKIANQSNPCPTVDAKRLELSERFGFDGVTIASSDWFSERQQVRWMDTIGSSLAESCRRMGIQEDQLGGQGLSSLQIEPPEISNIRGHSGCFGICRVNNATLRVGTACEDIAGTVVHEFTHQTDHKNALKAKALNPDIFPPFENQLHMEMFSELSPAQMNSFPLAKDALSEICAQLGKSSLMDKVQLKSIEFAPSDSQRRDLAEGTSAQLLASKESARLLGEVMEGLGIAHLGQGGYLKLSAAQHQVYQESLKKDGEELVLYVATRLGDKPMADLITDYKQDRVKQGKDASVAFMDIACSVHGYSAQPKALSDALLAAAPKISEISARFHPLARIAQEAGQVKPSSMMVSSMLDDVWRAESGMEKYLSNPCEVVARLIDRPQTMKRMGESGPSYSQHLSSSQLEDLNAGFAKFLDAAGVVRKGEPQLGTRGESILFAAKKISQKVATVKEAVSLERLASRFSFLVKKPDPQQNSKAPWMTAP
jgi:hypothetical protein